MAVDRARVAKALGDYDVGDELGRGGFGAVLAGRHRLIHRDVAIKVLHEEAIGEPGVRERFLAEAQVLAGLDHPHVVRVYDYVERDGLCLLVMERLTGGSLRQRGAQGLSQPAACAIGLAAAAALAAAHARRVLHRDVKPDNLLFTQAGLPKVTDFGIAKILESTGTTTTGLVGTPRYMAPEQIAGERLTAATDLYALGLVMYELLAGRPPFERNLAVPALFHHHLNVPPTPLAEAPEPVAAVIGRALEKRPFSRHADAEHFAVDLAMAAASVYGPGWLTASEVPTTLPDAVTAAARGTAARGTAVPVSPNSPVGSAPAVPPSPRQGREGTHIIASRGHRSPVAIDGSPNDRVASGRGAGGRRTALIAGGLAVALVAVSVVLVWALRSPGQPAGIAAYSGPTVKMGTSRLAGLAVGRNGMIAVSAGDRVLTVTPDGNVHWLAGSPKPSSSRATMAPSPVPTTAAQQAVLDAPGDLAVDPSGAVYVATGGSDGRIFKITSAGDAVAPVAGSGPDVDGFTGNNPGLATQAELSYPQGIAVDADGAILFCEGTRVRRVTVSDTATGAAEGTIETVAGTGGPGGRGTSGDGGSARDALLTAPTDIAVAGDGTVYVLDRTARTIRKIDPKGGISRYVGREPLPGAMSPSSSASTPVKPPAVGSPGDGSPAGEVTLTNPAGIALAPDGDLYIADSGGNAVRVVDATTGIINTFAGSPTATTAGDGGDPREARVWSPVAVAVDATGAVYVAQNDGTIRRVAAGIITTVLKAA